MSQKQTILTHLKKFGSISTMTAYSHYGITTCGQRVTELKRDGHNIEPIYPDGQKYALYIYHTKVQH